MPFQSHYDVSPAVKDQVYDAFVRAVLVQALKTRPPQVDCLVTFCLMTVVSKGVQITSENTTGNLGVQSFVLGLSGNNSVGPHHEIPASLALARAKNFFTARSTFWFLCRLWTYTEIDKCSIYDIEERYERSQLLVYHDSYVRILEVVYPLT